MNFNTFNRSNCGNARSGEPTISLTQSGTISFSKAASQALEIEPGALIEFHQDAESLRDWYLTKSTSKEKAFILRGKADSVMLASASLVSKIKKSLELNHIESSIRMPLAINPTEQDDVNYYAIITKDPKYNE